MFSFATSNSGWLRRYLLDSLQQLHTQTHPSGVAEPAGLEELHGLLHRTAKQNGLLMGCPVLEESRYRQLETFRFPEKSGDALMVYLDTLIEVGLSFLNPPSPSREGKDGQGRDALGDVGQLFPDLDAFLFAERSFRGLKHQVV